MQNMPRLQDRQPKLLDYARKIRSIYAIQKGKMSSFCTITYTPENMPITADGRLTLRKYDIQCFMKRARKWLNEKYEDKAPKFKYMLCGEYGGTHGLPHYHIIFFGLDNYLCDEMLRKNWREGITQSKALAGAHIRYTLKYMEKQIPYKERKKKKPKATKTNLF